MDKSIINRAQVRKNKYDYGTKNLLAMQVFRGKMFYEKVCYHCGTHFMTKKQDTLGCSNNVCQATISRRVNRLMPLRPVKGCGKYPKKEIDFVKYNMERKKC